MELAVNTALPAVAAVPRAREQESEWIDALFRQHCDRIFRYVFALVGDASAAEDVSAEVFVRAWQRRNALRDESRATAWLLAIARHLATDYVRGCVRRRQYEVPLGQFDLPPPEEVGEPASDDRIWRFFRRLTTEQQQVLYLRFVEGRPHEEVARTLGRTPGAVRAAQFRGLARMRRLLEEDHDR
ncbi:ECF RNA polymerase sigma factor SigX [bacterium HR29]|jgi:RNA polymerase sigma factor (sigma-70 family)|nr:ECF RNA polymerase sigma factor SigX [bacterium HR29]